MKRTPSTNRSSTAALPLLLAPLLCRIEPADIDAMLDAYDSGMCDTSTANCLSRAVSRQLGLESPCPLYRHADDSGELMIGRHRVAVPPAALHWLSLAELGCASGSLEFALEVPPGLGFDRISRSQPSPQIAPVTLI